MSLYLTNPYVVPISPSLNFKGDFSSYLKNFFKLAVEYRLNLVRQGNVVEEYTFIQTNLPSDTIKGKADSKLLLNLAFDNENEEPIPDTQEIDLKDLQEDLESVAPDDPKGFEVTLTLEEIIRNVIFNVRIFSIVEFGNIKWFWGIPVDTWYPGVPIKFEDILKALDFGTLDNPPLDMFYPIFNNFRDNIDIYYLSFLNEREEKE